MDLLQTAPFMRHLRSQRRRGYQAATKPASAITPATAATSCVLAAPLPLEVEEADPDALPLALEAVVCTICPAELVFNGVLLAEPLVGPLAVPLLALSVACATTQALEPVMLGV